MDWQPIETAPKDGSWMLVCGGAIRRYGWCRDTRPDCVVAQWDGIGWQFAWYDSGEYGIYDNPTHWMPLPPAPTGE